MIFCTLKSILNEKNLTITEVSKATNISRNTLTSLANGTSQGIQFDTLSILCFYFGISPEKFLVYFPLFFKIDPNRPKKFSLFFQTRKKEKNIFHGTVGSYKLDSNIITEITIIIPDKKTDKGHSMRSFLLLEGLMFEDALQKFLTREIIKSINNGNNDIKASENLRINYI